MEYLVDYFGSLLDAHTAVEPNTRIIASAAQLLEQVQSLCIVWYEHDFVIGCATHQGQDTVQHAEFAR